MTNNIRLVLNAVEMALRKYSPENIDVVINEETDMFYVTYHSRHNSFPISDDICECDKNILPELEKELDKRGIVYVW